MRKPKYGLWTSSSFSPLHSGQATAITSLIVSALNAFALSVPSIRGKPLQYNSLNTKVWRIGPFSPLHSGQATAIPSFVRLPNQYPLFQSPPFGASHCNRASVEDKKPVFRRFGERGRLLWLSARRF